MEKKARYESTGFNNSENTDWLYLLKVVKEPNAPQQSL